jgi:hypothetical protein
MGAWRRVIELSIDDADLVKLTSIARSRTEPASRVERARILLAYRKNASFFAVGQALGVHHQTVQRCVERALAYGPIAALGLVRVHGNHDERYAAASRGFHEASDIDRRIETQKREIETQRVVECLPSRSQRYGVRQSGTVD